MTLTQPHELGARKVSKTNVFSWLCCRRGVQNLEHVPVDSQGTKGAPVGPWHPIPQISSKKIKVQQTHGNIAGMLRNVVFSWFCDYDATTWIRRQKGIKTMCVFNGFVVFVVFKIWNMTLDSLGSTVVLSREPLAGLPVAPRCLPQHPVAASTKDRARPISCPP